MFTLYLSCCCTVSAGSVLRKQIKIAQDKQGPVTPRYGEIVPIFRSHAFNSNNLVHGIFFVHYVQTP